MKKLLKIDDVAELLNVAKKTAQQAVICKPDFPAPVYPAGHPRWLPDEVERWVRRQRPGARQSHQP